MAIKKVKVLKIEGHSFVANRRPFLFAVKASFYAKTLYAVL